MKYKITKERIAEIIGEASMCWSDIPSGVFDSKKACELVDELFAHLEYPLEHPEDNESNPQ